MNVLKQILEDRSYIVCGELHSRHRREVYVHRNSVLSWARETFCLFLIGALNLLCTCWMKSRDIHSDKVVSEVYTRHLTLGCLYTAPSAGGDCRCGTHWQRASLLLFDKNMRRVCLFASFPVDLRILIYLIYTSVHVYRDRYISIVYNVDTNIHIYICIYGSVPHATYVDLSADRAQYICFLPQGNPIRGCYRKLALQHTCFSVFQLQSLFFRYRGTQRHHGRMYVWLLLPWREVPRTALSLYLILV